MGNIPSIAPPLPLTGSTPISLSNAAEIPAEGKTTKVVFAAPHGKLVLIGLTAGHEWKEHATPNHALAQVISGECEFHLEGRTESLHEHDLLYMRPGLVHSVKALRETVILLTLVNSAGA